MLENSLKTEIKELNEKGVQIIENNVKIDRNGDSLKMIGNLVVIELNNKKADVENRRHTSDVICLLGNHDLVYFNGNGKCRFDYWQQKEVKELISSLNPQLYYIYEDLTTQEPHKYLFSHAGITKDWIDYNNLELKDLDSIDTTNLSALDHIPYSRGGYNKYGSCVWNDLEDFQLQTPYKGYYQIFGHSWGGRTKPLITDKHAMLDCCKPFVLNTETNKIEEWHI